MAASGGHWVKVAQGNSSKMIFVPKGGVIAGAFQVAKPGDGFPSSLDGLKVVKSLGGSTGAKLVSDENGNLYVMKTGANAEHIKSEYAADMAYKAGGADVPDAKLYYTSDGAPVKLAKFVDGQTLDAVDGQTAYVARLELRKNFVLDAVLGNWDVIGLNKDNVMVGKDGKTYRIDNGGSLLFRAQGGKKTNWGENPSEIFTMRTSAQGKPIFGDLELSQIVGQIKTVYANKTGILSALEKGYPASSSVISLVGKRLDNLKSLADYYDEFIGGFSSKEIEAEFAALWK